ncbi:MAG TPA: DUF4293 family protein, partial [Chitinophagaceae bacterium]|nr:DUF4293 family protein [Chitinophagaceae bacterium]
SPLNGTMPAETPLDGRSNTLLLVLTVLSALLSFLTIFQYSNRKMQLRWCWGGLLIQVLILGYEWYDAGRTAAGHKRVIGWMDNHLYLGMVIPVLTFALILMAINGIRKDEKLIRDSDRLR